jgi:DNA-binding transcriptional ArsR family regulator
MRKTLRALAEPSRLRIVELLRRGPRSVGEIGTRLRLRQPQVSKHLRVLKDAGLVEAHPEAQLRLYELRPNGLLLLDAWLEPYRRLAAAVEGKRRSRRDRVRSRGARRRSTESPPVSETWKAPAGTRVKPRKNRS